MSLAQVIYNMSNDRDFADQWRQDPESALAARGLKLSKEEFAFLSSGLKRGDEKVRLSNVALAGSTWY